MTQSFRIYLPKLPLHITKSTGGHFIEKIMEGQESINTIETDAIALSDVVREKINFLKIDTEGSEIKALTGALSILRISRAVIAMEFHTPERFYQIQNMMKELAIPFIGRLATPWSDVIFYGSV